MNSAPRRDFVYLAYLEDSGTKQKYKAWQGMTAVLVHDSLFTPMEVAVRETVVSPTSESNPIALQ